MLLYEEPRAKLCADFYWLACILFLGDRCLYCVYCLSCFIRTLKLRRSNQRALLSSIHHDCLNMFLNSLKHVSGIANNLMFLRTTQNHTQCDTCMSSIGMETTQRMLNNWYGFLPWTSWSLHERTLLIEVDMKKCNIIVSPITRNIEWWNSFCELSVGDICTAEKYRWPKYSILLPISLISG